MFNLFGKTKLLLAFEYGMVLAKTANALNVEITRELMDRAEEVLLNEFKKRESMELSTDMGVNILAIFQPSNDIDATDKDAEIVEGTEMSTEQ